jgi:hypothetical protein
MLPDILNNTNGHRFPVPSYMNPIQIVFFDVAKAILLVLHNSCSKQDGISLQSSEKL